MSHALGLPSYGVCWLDVIAAVAEPSEELVVVTDARRRQVYWAGQSLSPSFANLDPGPPEC